MMFLDVQNLAVEGTQRIALDGVSFTQSTNERVSIAGETGSGKSTLLKAIGGLVQVTEGKILFEGEVVPGPDQRLVPGHPQIAYMSQHFELPKFLRVEQILSYASVLDAEGDARVFEICRISHLLQRQSDQLSGGERQRIALARLLVRQPSLLLLDEPFSNLDMLNKQTMKGVLNDISAELSLSTILVSHDPFDTLPWADKIIVMKDGKLVQQGSPEEIYKHPVNVYVAGLFGRYSELSEKTLKPLGGKVNAIVRPEDLEVSLEPTEGLSAVVNDAFYFGTHWELSVDIDGESAIVQSERALSPGTTVFVKLKSPTEGEQSLKRLPQV